MTHPGQYGSHTYQSPETRALATITPESYDKDQAKTYVHEHPELVERSYTLRVPRKQKPTNKDKLNRSGKHHQPNDPIPERSQVIPRGALRRAINAGLLPKVLDKTILDA